MTDEKSEQNHSSHSNLHEECSASSRLPELSGIRAYYDQTWLDYRLLWLNPQNRAIHFGYWDEHTRSHSESLLNMNRVLTNHLGIRSGQRILDAGCGVGGSAIWLAKTYKVEVVGITPVASQVARECQTFTSSPLLANSPHLARCVCPPCSWIALGNSAWQYAWCIRAVSRPSTMYYSAKARKEIN